METDNLEKENFDEEAEIRRLMRSISLAEKYFLFFASCNQLPRQKELIKKIKSRLKGKKIVVIEFKEPIKSLLSELRKQLKNKKADAIIVLGLRYSIPSAKRGKETSFIATLNISRDSFADFLNCPLILFLPEYALTKIMNGAPDFFSVRSGVFFFENDENIMSQQISQAISTGYREHDALLVEERQQRIENLKELLREYQSLPENKRDSETEYQLKDKLADIYYKTANFSEAERLRKELLKEARQEDDDETAYQLNELALVYDSQGKYDEAIELYQQALLIGEKTIGKEHPDYATRLNNLALVYNSQGKYDEAIELYEKSKLIREKTLGKEHPDFAQSLNNLALVYKSQGKYDEAIELFKQALLIAEKTIGKEHPDYAIRLSNLAGVYVSQGKYNEAEELFYQVRQIREKILGIEHPDTALIYWWIADLRQKQGKYNEALPMYEEGLRIFVKFLGKNHLHSQLVKGNLEYCRILAGKK